MGKELSSQSLNNQWGDGMNGWRKGGRPKMEKIDRKRKVAKGVYINIRAALYQQLKRYYGSLSEAHIPWPHS